MKKNLLWLALAPMLLLAACADDDATTPDAPKVETHKEHKKAEKAEAKISTDNLICPQVAILQEAQTTHDYGGEKPDPSQLVSMARMKSVQGDCGYQDNGIDIAFTLHMDATRGHRLGGNQVNFRYFIALVDPAEDVLSRQMMTAHFEFAPGDKKTDLDEPLHIFLPLSRDAEQAGPDYRVLIGFPPHK